MIVVGAGPSGLAAATELAERGASVVVLDREPTAGGIPRHCDHYPFGMRELQRMLRGPEYARRLVERARTAGAHIRTAATVVALQPGPRLTVSSPDGVETLAPRRVLLCTGVRESSRMARQVGGTRPGGVLSSGALQGLVHLEGLVPFRRPVIVGTELVSFSAILTCRHAGIRPVAMVEAGSRPTARHPAGWFPSLVGVPLLLNTTLEAIEGESRVEAVVLRDADGSRRLETDGVVFSGRFRPDDALLGASHLALGRDTGGAEVDQYGRCSDPDCFAAGNLLRPAESAGWSWQEGRAVGRAIALSLRGELPPHAAALRVDTAVGALKFVLPQRLVARSADAPAPALPTLQLRVERAVRGRLVLRLNGERIHERRLASLPERRVSLPLSLVPRDARGVLEASVE